MPDSDRIIAQSHIDVEERVRARAHEIWLARQRSGAPGSELDDWLGAEREVLGGESVSSAQSRATTVGDAHRPGRELTGSLGQA